MCPDTTETAPNSPMARALHSSTPYSSAQRMFGKVTRQKICQPPAPSEAAASSWSAPCCCISGISSRATNGKVTKSGGQHDAGRGEDDLDVVLAQPRAEPAVRAEQQHEHQAGDHRRDRERQVDQRQQQVLAGEAEPGDRPAGAMPNTMLAGTHSAATSSVSLIAATRIGLGDVPRGRRRSQRRRLRRAPRPAASAPPARPAARRSAISSQRSQSRIGERAGNLRSDGLATGEPRAAAC